MKNQSENEDGKSMLHPSLNFLFMKGDLDGPNFIFDEIDKNWDRQIIAGTLAPTTGSISVNVKAAALVELGSGFNPEFTGRENVYMNGAIMATKSRLSFHEGRLGQS